MDSSATRAAFNQHAAEWELYTQTPLGRLRQELTLHHLLRHLRACPRAAWVLDAGSGSGGYALALARHGYHVCLLDLSPQMLGIARRAATASDPALLRRLEFCCATTREYACRPGAPSFAAVLVHTLLEYVEHPAQTLAELAGLLEAGGILSVLVANPSYDPLRWAWVRGDLQRARVALHEPVASPDLFGLTRQAVTPAEVKAAFQAAGLRVTACYGIRVFAEFVPVERLQDERSWADLWQLELAASTMAAYRPIARYLHFIARRRA